MYKPIIKTIYEKKVKEVNLPLITVVKDEIKFNQLSSEVLSIKYGDFLMFFWNDVTNEFGIGKSTIIQTFQNGKVKMIHDAMTNKEIPKYFGSKVSRSKSLTNYTFKYEGLYLRNKYVTQKLLKNQDCVSKFIIENNPVETEIETAFGTKKILVFPVSLYKETIKKTKTYRDFK